MVWYGMVGSTGISLPEVDSPSLSKVDVDNTVQQEIFARFNFHRWSIIFANACTHAHYVLYN